MSIKKFRASRVNNTTVSSYVGQPGDIFYDEVSGKLKISDGHTVGGHYIDVVVATPTQLGGIKAGPGANVSVDGTLTIDTTGIPLSIGDLYIAQANISAVNANENLNLLTNGTGDINIVGNLHVHTTAQGPDYPIPILAALNDGNVIVNGNLVTNGTSYFYGNVTEIGNLKITGNSINTGTSIFNGFTTFVGDTIHTGNIEITGIVVNNGLSIFNGNLTIAGEANLIGNTSVTGNTLVTGNTTVTGTTTVTGNTTVTGSAFLTGNTTVTGNTLVTGTTTVAGNTLVTGNTTVTGNTSVVGTTYLTGNSYVTGTATITGNSYITGNTFVQGPTTVTGNITVTGNSVQTGLSTFVVSQQNSTIGAVEITGDTNGLSQTPITTGVMLHVTGQASTPSRVYNDAMNNYALYVGRRFNGTMASPTAVLANDDISRFVGGVYTSAGWANIGPSRISFVSSENQTGTNQGGRIELWTTANSAGPAYANIQRIATVDAAVGVQATQFTTAGNVTAGNVNATLHGNVVGVATGLATAGTTAAGTFLTGSLAITPTNIGKNNTSTQTFTLAGLTTSHKVVVTSASDLAYGVVITAAYASGANTLSVQFSNFSGGGITPAAMNLQYFAWV